MKWIIEEVPELKGYTIEWAEPGNYYLSRRNLLFRAASLKPPFEFVAAIDAPFYKRIASRSRLAQRLLRFMFGNVVPLAGGDLFVTFDKSIGIVRDGKFLALKNLVRPCRVLRSACAIDENGRIFFGEYLANDERGEMRIYRYQPGGDALDIAYVFPPGSIKHIHGLYFDRFTRSIFCLTGDAEKECRILSSDDGFQTMKVVGEGDETWRAVSVLFDADCFYYGMDAEFRTNHIYKVSRRDGSRESLGEVSGTVFYSKRLGDDLFFTTTAENAPSQTENVAALWRIDRAGRCEQVFSLKKDRWHPTLFMFGTIHFPYGGDAENELYFYTVGVENDNRTFRLTAEENAAPPRAD